VKIYWDWETEARGPRRPAAVELLEVAVVHVKDNGFKDDTGAWRNWSRFASPGAMLMPQAGDRVRIGLDKSGFIRQLAIVGPNGAAQPVARPAVAGAAPAPAPRQVETEPDWLTGQAPALAEPPTFAGVHIEQNLRETVITRLACIKAAAEACAGLPTEDIIAAASAFEQWCIR
jgi:hypothetical protein